MITAAVSIRRNDDAIPDPFVGERGAQRRAHSAKLIRVSRNDEHTRYTNQDMWINERVGAGARKGLSFGYPHQALVLTATTIPRRRTVIDAGPFTDTHGDRSRQSAALVRRAATGICGNPHCNIDTVLFTISLRLTVPVVTSDRRTKGEHMTDESSTEGFALNPGAKPNRTRRVILTAGMVGATAAALGVPAVVELTTASAAENGTLALTPTCTDGHDTPANIEGPFFKRKSPLRSNLVTNGVTGVLLTLSGTVFTERCVPVNHALLEFWQADRHGNYDNKGFTLRGHQFTDAKGGYALETIVPKDYPGRTTHIHVKVQAPHGPVLTSQLFFPDNTKAYGMNVARLNAGDGFINRQCTIHLGKLAANHYPGRFDFVIKI
jgi:protocatechuate 3,4-dioxygenase beta subunit